MYHDFFFLQNFPYITYFFLHTVGSAHVVRITHVCGMSPRRGSVFCHIRGFTPTAVLCHRDAVHMAVVVLPNTIHRQLNDASHYLNKIEVIRIPIKS